MDGGLPGPKSTISDELKERRQVTSLEALQKQRNKKTAEAEAKRRTAAIQPSDAVRGVSRRDETAWLLFRALARGDFHHDFGENQPTRDKITKDDEPRFFEIAKLVTTKGSVWLRTNFQKNIGKNLYSLIKDQINTILPPQLPPLAGAVATPLSTDMISIKKEGVDPGQFANEDELLSFIGLNWVGLKAEIVAADAAKGAVLGAAFKGRVYADNIIPNGREYEIRWCPYRESLDRNSKDYKTNRAPIDALKIVTGGKTSFACIIDASGGFPLSDLRNRDLLKADADKTEVYIIENLENSADSATKILPPPILPKKGEGPLPPKLRTLRDKENTVNYPLWANSADPKSNIYSTLHIVLNRIKDDTIEANLLVRDGNGNTVESYSIGDVSTASNVKNATLYALATMLDKGGITNDALVYTLIKRMGDWCQALSLLDLDRKYTVIDPDGVKPSEQKTLRELQAGGTEVGIVTNDRILLAFCIMLGLNVFYTSAMDIARLLYFKNTLDAPVGKAVEERITQALATIPDVAGALSRIPGHITAIKKVRDDFIRDKLSTPILPTYIFNLRNLLSNLARLRLDLAPLKVQADEAQSRVKDMKIDPITRLGAANTLVSVVTKIELDIKYNESLLADIGKELYPNSRAEKIRLDELTGRLASGGRLAKSVGVTEAKDILRETRNDIQQLQGKTINLLVDLPVGTTLLRTNATDFNLPPDATKKENTVLTYTEILSVMTVLQALLPGVQRGGDAASIAAITRAYAALTTRSIRVLLPGVSEVTSTPNVYTLGSTYYDRALRGYTVADEYIITEEDLSTFTDGFRGASSPEYIAGIEGDVDYQLQYISLRYLLLRVDIAQIEMEGLVEDVIGRAPAKDEDDMEEAAVVENPITALALELARADADQEGTLEALETKLNDIPEKPENEYLGALVPGTPGYARLESLKVLGEGIGNAIGALNNNSPEEFLRALYTIVAPSPLDADVELPGARGGAPGDDVELPEAGVAPPDPASALWSELRTGLGMLHDDLVERITALEPPAALKAQRDAERQETVAIEQGLKPLSELVLKDVRIVDGFIQRNGARLGVVTPADIESLAAALRLEILGQVLGDPDGTYTTKDVENIAKIKGLPSAFRKAYVRWLEDNHPERVVPPEDANEAERDKWGAEIEKNINSLVDLFEAHLRFVAGGQDIAPPQRRAAVGLEGGRHPLFGGRRKRKTPQ